jgi:antitoxin Phd
VAIWQLQEAKQKLSTVVDRALSEGPQTITRHGVETAVVVSVAEYRRLQQAKPRSLRQVLLDSVGRDHVEPDFADLLPPRDLVSTRPPVDFDEP